MERSSSILRRLHASGTVPFEGGSKHGLLARSEVRYDIKYFGPYRHDTNTRTVPYPESQHGEEAVHSNTETTGWFLGLETRRQAASSAGVLPETHWHEGMSGTHNPMGQHKHYSTVATSRPRVGQAFHRR
jgi:hypothetical protein